MINILLLNWNSNSDIEIALHSILKSNYKCFRIILIDNYSRQDDIEKLKKIYRYYKNLCELYLVLNKKNYGYAGGNNKGYSYLTENDLDGDILILNPDVVISENTILELQNSLVDNVGGVMCRTLKSTGEIMYDYIKLNGFFQRWMETDEYIVETSYLAGSCMLLKRKIIDKIGLFDEKYFMYWEEVDLSFRIKNEGYKLVSTTKTSIIRKENSSERSANAIYFSIRNSFMIYKKYDYFKGYELLLYIFFSLLSATKQSASNKNFFFIRNFLSGIIDGAKNLFG